MGCCAPVPASHHDSYWYGSTEALCRRQGWTGDLSPQPRHLNACVGPCLKEQKRAGHNQRLPRFNVDVGSVVEMGFLPGPVLELLC